MHMEVGFPRPTGFCSGKYVCYGSLQSEFAGLLVLKYEDTFPLCSLLTDTGHRCRWWEFLFLLRVLM